MALTPELVDRVARPVQDAGPTPGRAYFDDADFAGLACNLYRRIEERRLPLMSSTLDAGWHDGRGMPGCWCWPEIERKLGFAERLGCYIEDPRAPERVRHGLAKVIRF